MKSPFTGGEAVLKTETRTAKFRGKEYDYTYVCYVCMDTKEEFTTTEIDEVNVMQVYNQYRVENGIPFPDEITELRRKYGLSAKTMSVILGFGDNQFRLYENGEMPSVSNGRLLESMINYPKAFLNCALTVREDLPASTMEKIEKIVSESNTEDSYHKFLTSFVFSYNVRNIYTGYAKASLSKLKNTMLYFIQNMGGVYKTTMNKLLFYTDFASYRATGKAMTGLSYDAITYGPVPRNYSKAYSAFNEIVLTPYHNNGYDGEKLESDISFDENAFTEEEKRILELVLHTFKNMSATEISERSHQEDAWKDNVNGHRTIDFHYAFSLKNI